MQFTETYTKSLSFLTGPLGEKKKVCQILKYKILADWIRFLAKSCLHRSNIGNHDTEIFKGSYSHLQPWDVYRWKDLFSPPSSLQTQTSNLI